MAAALAGIVAVPLAAQQGAKPPENQQPAPQPPVNVDARDANVRETLAKLFKDAKISNYSIASDVYGVVTISLKDRPFEEALTFVTRAASPPLTWTKTDGFYEVKLRRVRRASGPAVRART